jgi:hypothetical protein
MAPGPGAATKPYQSHIQITTGILRTIGIQLHRFNKMISYNFHISFTQNNIHRKYRMSILKCNPYSLH